MTSQVILGARFRTLHEEPGTFVLPNPGDAGTARLLEHAGFRALATSSAALAMRMGVADGAVPRERMMGHVASLAIATSLPLSADLGNGFGRDPETVAETIRLAAAAGAVGGSIEDSTGDPTEPLLPFSLASERVVAAVEAARSLPFPFTLTARAENFLVDRPCLDDVLERLSAYRDAGADVLYAPGLPDADAVAAVVQVASGRPVNVLAQGRGVASSMARLAELGVKRISLGSGLSRLALAAVLEAIDELGSGKLGFLDRAIPLGRLDGLFTPSGTERGA
jgi:2-methylisocitrate lyase-like PEP mutase family enzyme